ncbi:alpha/beta hydrolase [Carboxylicivirga sp. RSCT41]|uniref:alpha/beta hydrolase n=1 Tax=Carboxylicivirga agarovorans TaxID=3417570 RepID=UPI003D3561E7
MKTLRHPFIFILLFFLINSCSNQTDTVSFQLDMREAIDKGWLNPAADKVGLRGDIHPLSWGETYLCDGPSKSGIYTLTVPFDYVSDSVELNYKIKVDGTDNPDEGWQQGRNHRLILHKNIPQTVKQAWGAKAPEPRPTISGLVDIIRDFDSDQLTSRDIYVYLPPGYHDSNQRYRVLYMHDGQNIFDEASIGQEWGLDEAAETLINSGSIEPLIIVGIANTSDRIDEYTPSRMHWQYSFTRMESNSANATDGNYITESGEALKVKTDGDTLKVILPGYENWQNTIKQGANTFYQPRAGITFTFELNTQNNATGVKASKPPMGGKGQQYNDFIIEQLKPYIDSIYRTKASPEHTAIGGSSLGGLISLYTGLRHPETFHQIVALSPSLWWDKAMLFEWVDAIKVNDKQKIWLYMGGQEGEEAVNNARSMHKLLKKSGWHVNYEEAELGQHNETAWKQQANNILFFVAGK